MIRRVLVVTLVVLGILSMVGVIIKTRSEIIHTREIARSELGVAIEQLVAKQARSGVIARWRHEPADITWNTSSAPNENGEQFAERAGRDFTAMLTAFPKR